MKKELKKRDRKEGMEMFGYYTINDKCLAWCTCSCSGGTSLPVVSVDQNVGVGNSGNVYRV